MVHISRTGRLQYLYRGDGVFWRACEPHGLLSDAATRSESPKPTPRSLQTAQVRGPVPARLSRHHRPHFN